MRAIVVILVYAVAIFGGGALLAPWVYKLLQTLSQGTSALHGLASVPFHRVVNRCLLVLAIAGVWPVARLLGLKTWKDFGLSADFKALPAVLKGLVIGLASLALVVGVELAVGHRTIANGLAAGAFLKSLGKALLSGVAVALIEETVFRGLIYRGLRLGAGMVVAIAVSSSFYAIVHFFQPVRWNDAIGAGTGFLVLGKMMAGWADWHMMFPALINLFLVGCILARAVEWTGSLWLSVGLHGGWVFWLKMAGTVTKPSGAARWGGFFGTDRLIDGWLVVLTLASLWVFLEKRERGVAVLKSPK